MSNVTNTNTNTNNNNNDAVKDNNIARQKNLYQHIDNTLTSENPLLESEEEEYKFQRRSHLHQLYQLRKLHQQQQTRLQLQLERQLKLTKSQNETITSKSTAISQNLNEKDAAKYFDNNQRQKRYKNFDTPSYKNNIANELSWQNCEGNLNPHVNEPKLQKSCQLHVHRNETITSKLVHINNSNKSDRLASHLKAPDIPPPPPPPPLPPPSLLRARTNSNSLASVENRSAIGCKHRDFATFNQTTLNNNPDNPNIQSSNSAMAPSSRSSFAQHDSSAQSSNGSSSSNQFNHNVSRQQSQQYPSSSSNKHHNVIQQLMATNAKSHQLTRQADRDCNLFAMQQQQQQNISSKPVLFNKHQHQQPNRRVLIQQQQQFTNHHKQSNNLEAQSVSSNNNQQSRAITRSHQNQSNNHHHHNHPHHCKHQHQHHMNNGPNNCCRANSNGIRARCSISNASEKSGCQHHRIHASGPIAQRRTHSNPDNLPRPKTNSSRHMIGTTKCSNVSANKPNDVDQVDEEEDDDDNNDDDDDEDNDDEEENIDTMMDNEQVHNHRIGAQKYNNHIRNQDHTTMESNHNNDDHLDHRHNHISNNELLGCLTEQQQQQQQQHHRYHLEKASNIKKSLSNQTQNKTVMKMMPQKPNNINPTTTADIITQKKYYLLDNSSGNTRRILGSQANVCNNGKPTHNQSIIVGDSDQQQQHHHNSRHHKGFNCRFASQLYLLLHLSITLSLIYYSSDLKNNHQNNLASDKVGNARKSPNVDGKYEVFVAASDMDTDTKNRQISANYLPSPSLLKLSHNSPMIVNSETMQPNEQRAVTSVVMSPTMQNNYLNQISSKTIGDIQKSRTDRSISTKANHQSDNDRSGSSRFPTDLSNGDANNSKSFPIDHESFDELFKNPFHSKNLIHYYISYLLSTSSLILILYRLCATSPKDIVSTNCEDRNKKSKRLIYHHNHKFTSKADIPYSITDCTRCKSKLDYAPVLLGSISLGLIQLIVIGLEIAKFIDDKHVYLPILKFIFVFFVMQFILTRVSDTSKSHNLTNFALAHLLATQVSLWLMKLNYVNDYYQLQQPSNWITNVDMVVSNSSFNPQYYLGQNNRYHRSQTNNIWPSRMIEASVDSGSLDVQQNNNSGKFPIYMTQSTSNNQYYQLHHQQIPEQQNNQQKDIQVAHTGDGGNEQSLRQHQSRSIEQLKSDRHNVDSLDGYKTNLDQLAAHRHQNDNSLNLNITSKIMDKLLMKGLTNQLSQSVKEQQQQQQSLGVTQTLIDVVKNPNEKNNNTDIFKTILSPAMDKPTNTINNNPIVSNGAASVGNTLASSANRRQIQQQQQQQIAVPQPIIINGKTTTTTTTTGKPTSMMNHNNQHHHHHHHHQQHNIAGNSKQMAIINQVNKTDNAPAKHNNLKQMVTSVKENHSTSSSSSSSKGSSHQLPKPVITATSLDENNRIINVTIRHPHHNNQQQSQQEKPTNLKDPNTDQHKTRERSVTTIPPITISKHTIRVLDRDVDKAQHSHDERRMNSSNQMKSSLPPPPSTASKNDNIYDNNRYKGKSKREKDSHAAIPSYHHHNHQPNDEVVYSDSDDSGDESNSNNPTSIASDDQSYNPGDTPTVVDNDGADGMDSDGAKPLSNESNLASTFASDNSQSDPEEIPDESFMFNEASNLKEAVVSLYAPIENSKQDLKKLVTDGDQQRYSSDSLLTMNRMRVMSDNGEVNSSTYRNHLAERLSLKREQPSHSTANTFTDLLMPIVHHYHILLIAILFNLWLNNSNQSLIQNGLKKIRNSSICSEKSYPASVFGGNNTTTRLPNNVDKFRKLSYVVCKRSMSPPPRMRFYGPPRSESDRQTYIKQRNCPSTDLSAISSYLEASRDRNHKQKLEFDSKQLRHIKSKRSQSLESLDSLVFHNGGEANVSRHHSVVVSTPSESWGKRHNNYREGRKKRRESRNHNEDYIIGTRSSSMSLLSSTSSTHHPQMNDLKLELDGGGDTSTLGSALSLQKQSNKASNSSKGFFVGMLVLSSAFIVLLLKNNILTMTTHSVIQLISAIITLIGLMVNWRKKRSMTHKSDSLHTEEMNQMKAADKVESNRSDSYLYESSNGNYFYKQPFSMMKEQQLLDNNRNKQRNSSVINNKMKTKNADDIKKDKSSRQDLRLFYNNNNNYNKHQLNEDDICQSKNIDFMSYIFLLAAYYCGLSVSLESYYELSKLLVTTSNDGWHAPTSVLSHLMLNYSLLNSTFIHVIIIFKGIMLVIQVTLQSIFIRVSCLYSIETKQIFAFLILTNLSLWILEVSDQGVPWGSYDTDRLKVMNQRTIFGILVTLSRFYQALVFMQHWK